MLGILIGTTIRRRIKRKLEQANALSSETAVNIEKELSSIEKRHLKALVKLKIVGKTEDGRYYINCKDKKHC
ncbi:MAG: hypothetical protein QW146_09165 [Candidatus Bathyarchaeia archaeon]